MKTLSLFIVLLALGACKTTVHSDDVKVKTEGYEVELSNDSQGEFCPPGQAKKGHC